MGNGKQELNLILDHRLALVTLQVLVLIPALVCSDEPSQSKETALQEAWRLDISPLELGRV